MKKCMYVCMYEKNVCMEEKMYVRLKKLMYI